MSDDAVSHLGLVKCLVFALILSSVCFIVIIFYLMSGNDVLGHQLSNMTGFAYDFCRSADATAELANKCLDVVDDGSLAWQRVSYFDCSHKFEDLLGVEGVAK